MVQILLLTLGMNSVSKPKQQKQLTPTRVEASTVFTMGGVPDPFPYPNVKGKKWFGYARLLSNTNSSRAQINGLLQHEYNHRYRDSKQRKYPHYS